jgi:hypothetical protein
VVPVLYSFVEGGLRWRTRGASPEPEPGA